VRARANDEVLCLANPGARPRNSYRTVGWRFGACWSGRKTLAACAHWETRTGTAFAIPVFIFLPRRPSQETRRIRQTMIKRLRFCAMRLQHW
jgi:hypothetical protein